MVTLIAGLDLTGEGIGITTRTTIRRRRRDWPTAKRCVSPVERHAASAVEVRGPAGQVRREKVVEEALAARLRGGGRVRLEL